jgi:hypothetical protein
MSVKAETRVCNLQKLSGDRRVFGIRVRLTRSVFQNVARACARIRFRHKYVGEAAVHIVVFVACSTFPA